MMDQKYLAEIKARCEAATPGPWAVKYPLKGHIGCRIGIKVGIYDVAHDVKSADNAAFIAHARTDIPALIAEVERLTARADQAALNYQQKCRDVFELEKDNAAKDQQIATLKKENANLEGMLNEKQI